MKRFTSILIIAAVLISFVSLKFLNTPYIWICLIWMVVCMYTMMQSTNNRIKAVLLNLGIVFLVFGGFEGYLSVKSLQKLSNRDEVRNQEGDIVERVTLHPILGYAPIKDAIRSWKRYYGNELLFDVIYTVGKDGLRISPPVQERDDMDCALFFGCSDTWGAGMNDNETMPYLVGLKSERLRIFNFGYSGYGPHQMLAALQHGFVENIVDCQPKYVVYQGKAFHAIRVANKVPWGRLSPKYILGENGEAVYQGNKDNPSTINKVKAQFNKSFIIRSLLPSISTDEINLLVAVVDSSRKGFESRYPGSEFHVIFWDQQKHSREIVSGLKKRGIRVHLISEILPDYSTRKYRLSKDDAHPNQLAHEIIAEYVINEIIR